MQIRSLVLSGLLFLSAVVFSHAVLAGTTILEFTDVPGGNNDSIPFNWGSFATTNTSGTTVIDGGTPDVSLFWIEQGDGWDRHSSNVWSALDSAGNVNVAQLDWHMEIGIGFDVATPTTVFALDSVLLGNATDQVEPDYGWDISIVERGSIDVVQSWNSEALGPGGVTTVEFDFVGEPGTSYELFFVPTAPDEFVFRTAMDNLTFSQNPVATASGDFDGNGMYDCSDVDALVAEIVGMTNTASFDLTDDGSVNGDDLSAWLAEAGEENLGPGRAYLVGDANLDGSVDVGDFNAWNSNKFTTTPAWCSGDFNADGSIDVGDFNLWNGNKFTSSDISSVPEPDALALIMVGLLGLVALRRS